MKFRSSKGPKEQVPLRGLALDFINLTSAIKLCQVLIDVNLSMTDIETEGYSDLETFIDVGVTNRRKTTNSVRPPPPPPVNLCSIK